MPKHRARRFMHLARFAPSAEAARLFTGQPTAALLRPLESSKPKLRLGSSIHPRGWGPGVSGRQPGTPFNREFSGGDHPLDSLLGEKL
jgi:hypothetical protein